jgi:hypothetical protein
MWRHVCAHNWLDSTLIWFCNVYVLCESHIIICFHSLPNWTIFMSLDVQIGGLLMFFECQKYWSNAKNKEKWWMIIYFNFFEKITLDLSLLQAHNFLIFILFLVIKNLMNVLTRASQNFIVFQKQRCNK